MPISREAFYLAICLFRKDWLNLLQYKASKLFQAIKLPFFH